MYAHSNLSVSGSLSTDEEESVPITGENVQLMEAGNVLDTDTTNNDGEFELDYMIPSVGDHTFYCKLDSDNYCEGVSVSNNSLIKIRFKLKDPQELEWLIYESLSAYKQMKEKGEDFILRISEDKTKELIDKHTNPINYLLQKLILKHDYEATRSELEFKTNEYTYVITDELLEILFRIIL